MDWNQRLKLLVVDDNQRGRIKSKLIFLDAESRASLFDDNNDAVRASLLGLIEPAAAEGSSHSKRPRTDARPSVQSFAESAANFYRQWEQAEKTGVENGGHKNFLVVSTDPFGNFPEGFVVWIRKCYRDLKEILTKAEKSERFILLGTAGIGKSVFTLFWICYLATLKEKVAWKVTSNEWYLLDFSKEGSSSAQRFSEVDNELQKVLSDPNAWLIIDGEQPLPLYYECHILLACSVKKENYHEFEKHGMACKRYVPVWSEEELNKFLDDFEALKVNYAHMDVPTKVVVMKNFEKLGGVPRYVLRSAKFEDRLTQVGEAVQHLDKTACLKLFTGEFENETMSDRLVHIKCKDESYKSKFYDFASPYVQDEFENRFTKLSKVEVVDFLKGPR